MCASWTKFQFAKIRKTYVSYLMVELVIEEENGTRRDYSNFKWTEKEIRILHENLFYFSFHIFFFVLKTEAFDMHETYSLVLLVIFTFDILWNCVNFRFWCALSFQFIKIFKLNKEESRKHIEFGCIIVLKNILNCRRT